MENCGLVMLMREKTDVPNVEIASVVDVETSVHVEKPKTVAEVCKVIGKCSYDTLMFHLQVTPEQQELVQKLTCEQSYAASWFNYRRDRITASNFKYAVDKVNIKMEVINPKKTRTILSKVCGYYANHQSKSTSWGIGNERVARKMYENKMRKSHKMLTVLEPGFFIDMKFPFLGASPDGIVSCQCHKPGLLEIKCPWTFRGLSIAEYASKPDACLEVTDDIIRLKREHAYFYQVQCQMHATNTSWCDLFLCTTRETFLEKIYFDADFFSRSVEKAQVVFENVIMPEIFLRKLETLIQEEKDVKLVLSSLIDKVSMNVF